MFYFVVITFVIMLLFPVAASFVHYLRNKAGVLYIDANKTKDPRYFAKSFNQLMRRAVHSYNGSHVVKLSRSEEPFLFAHEELPNPCKCLVISLIGTFHIDEGCVFEREIYAETPVIVQQGVSIRALSSTSSIALGNEVVVERWIDAEESLSVLDDCDLGTSASSQIRMVIGRNGSFHRLYAPCIDVGTYEEDVVEHASMDIVPFVDHTIYWNRSSLGKDDRDRDYDELLTNEDGMVRGTTVSHRSVKVLERIIVAGDIRSHHAVRLCEGAQVYGNIFAEDDIIIGDGCRVYGTVFSQSDIFIGNDVVLGTKGQERSVIARDSIVFRGRARVYGYVSCENGGSIVPDNETGMEASTRIQHRLSLIPKEEHHQVIATPTIETFANGTSPYRRNTHLVQAVLPAGLTLVIRSAFFGCSSLESIEWNSDLQEIDDFSFYGCSSLKTVDLHACHHLIRIGASAFEGCAALEKVILPPHLTQLGEAAFSGCSALTSVGTRRCMELQEIGGHAFMDCTSLKVLYIPHTVMRIGISAFLGCTSLERAVIPDSTQKLGMYAFHKCSALKSLSLPDSLEPDEPQQLPEQVTVTKRIIAKGGTSDD